MKMDIIAGSQNDEYYTPEYAIKPLVKYLKPYSNIICPFDTLESNFYKVLYSKNFNVYCSHIKDGYNFFDMSIPKGTDYIISNPPYSLKNEVLSKLFYWDIPFAMLVGSVGLFESKTRFNLFKNNDFEIMYFDKRISYLKDYKESKPSSHPPFSSIYITHNVLPKKIIFEEIIK